MKNYIGIIHKDADSDFGVSFPDFPGVVTAGRTLDEARDEAADVLIFHAEGLLEDGLSLPEPSTLEAVMADADFRDGVAIVVSVKTEAAKAVRVNITLPADMLTEIDTYATSHGYTRSGFLVEAARRTLHGG